MMVMENGIQWDLSERQENMLGPTGLGILYYCDECVAWHVEADWLYSFGYHEEWVTPFEKLLELAEAKRVRVLSNDTDEPELVGMEGDCGGIMNDGLINVYLDGDKLPTRFPENELEVIE